MNSITRQRLLMILTLAAVGIFAADRILLSPLSDLWQRRSERIGELRTLIDRGTILIDRQDLLEQRWRQLQDRSLPANSSEAEGLIHQAANRWRIESDMNLESFKPQWLAGDDDYRTCDCQINAKGELEAINRFLFALETDPLPIRLESLSYDSQDENGSRFNLTARFSGLQFTKGNR